MAEHKYPFSSGEELKRVISQIDISFDNDNITGSFRLAKDDIVDIVSREVYDEAMNHYNSGNYVEGGSSLPDQLVDNLKPAFANFAMMHHFIWLQLRISNNAVTVTKSDNETTAYKYMTDEAKDKLLQTAWAEMNTLIDFLTDNSIPQWIQSPQYAELQNLLIKDYKEFDKYYGIDRNASFFIKTRAIQQEVIDEYLSPRYNDDDLPDDVLDRKLKRACVFLVMSIATIRFDYYYLPGPVRRSIDNEMEKKKNNDAAFVKEKLSGYLKEQADIYLRNIDNYLAEKHKTDDVSPFKQFEDTYTDGDKFVSMI